METQPQSLVANAEGMLLVNFLKHCRTRHPEMRFLGQREHRLAHLANPDLEHTHAPPYKEEDDA